MNAPPTGSSDRSQPLAGDAPHGRRTTREIVLALLWGAFLAALVTRGLFRPGAGEFVANHDHQGYGLRLIEFRESVRRGDVFPQWCVHFRGGLGSPFFNYYQPGFYYVGSLAPASWPMARQVAAASFVFSLVGYVGMWGLVRRIAGNAPAMAAATLLLTAPYAYAELFVRGDYSEYAAMMLTPGFLWGLSSFMARPTASAAWGAALAGAALVCTHPAVSLVAFGFAGLFVASRLAARSKMEFLRGVMALAAACGIAAFYWAPVFVESKWVSAEEAWQGRVFDGYYHYSKHFLPLAWMIGPQVTPTPIPVKLGLVHGLAAAAGATAIVVGWRRASTNSRALAICAALFLFVSLWLITPSSAVIWRHLPLLERIQFPWRLLALVHVGGALAFGVGLAMLRRPLVVLAAALLFTVFATGSAWRRGETSLITVPEPATAAEIAEHYFAPDLADEWLPRGARSLRIKPEERRPVCGPHATADGYSFDVDELRCDVRTTAASYVVLPHYYFPVGWSATLDGRPLELTANPAGLMRAELPAEAAGELVVRWRTTAAKRYAIAASCFALLAWAAAARWLAKRAESSPDTIVSRAS